MEKLHLVGFTSDLKHLIFAKRRGAKSGSFMVPVDPRLTRTLSEVERLERAAPKAQAGSGAAANSRSFGARMPAVTSPQSKLTPKEIQNSLRAGKTTEQVAKLAETDEAWIAKFMGPVAAERLGVIELVQAARISKPRLGPSSMSVRDCVNAVLATRRIAMEPDQMDSLWAAARRGRDWQVSFVYPYRGSRVTLRFVYDPETRSVQAMNAAATQHAWMGSPTTKAKRRPRSKA